MKKILISCQFASNKGDRAIAEFIISCLKKIPNTSITLSTTEPHLWQNLESVNVVGFGYKNFLDKIKNSILGRVLIKIQSLFYSKLVYPRLLSYGNKSKLIKFLSKDYIELVKESDLVIVTGGHHITSIRSRNALFSVTYDIGLISIFAKKYILWSQTIGPIQFDNAKAKAFFYEVLRKAEAIYVRDANSIECIHNIFPNLKNIKKSYDSVFGFGGLNYLSYQKRDKKIGISIFNGLPKAFRLFPDIAKLLDLFADKGYSIEFFRMEHNDKELDDINSIVSQMSNKNALIKIFPFQTSTIDHLNEVATCRFFIGYKTHSVIMALSTSTPLLAICYHQKTYDFMQDYGMEMYAVDDEKFDLKKTLTIIELLIQNKDDVYKAINLKSKKIADRVLSDFSSEIEG
ncbi:MAG: polysaccharide pyruvyl transferase family protein [Verrucomicrobiaceae bacterium]|nr:polysaccharide pyruvyl transferase family protein [Verrucomicrobiaceae bacterium]